MRTGIRAKMVVLDIAQPTPCVTLRSIPYATNDVDEGQEPNNKYHQTLHKVFDVLRHEKKVPPTRTCPDVSIIFVPNLGS